MDRFLAWNPARDKNRKLVKHLRRERDALFTFLRKLSVPALNWVGRAGHPIRRRHPQGLGREPHHDGALTRQIIASVLRAHRQQGVDPCAIIEDVLRSPRPRLASLPSQASG